MIVTDEEIKKKFSGTNFGRDDHRQLLANSVLKRALGYHCGYTITNIMWKMELTTTEGGGLTERGRMFCYDHYNLARSG